MTIQQIKELTSATTVCGINDPGKEIRYAFASDLMSDVLRLDFTDVILITGLCNLQTIRTAEMAEVSCLLFVRGKRVTDEMKELATENNMILLETEYSMYRTVGELYTHGLLPVY
ncbi:hypothetical protein LJC57_06100 [Parabacteroides sp. OttesenSCG-928-G07]|nr:hypothetical protein [Parabacteroides sp. OttesenSCG-928-G07]